MGPPKRRAKLLSHTRPPSLSKVQSRTLSSRTTRTIIRSHHQLHKELARAQAANNNTLAASLQRRIEAAGGLLAYQQASVQGQSATRGGDASRVLVEWMRAALRHEEPAVSGAADPNSQCDRLASQGTTSNPKFRLLEVGALRVDNACTRSGLFNMTRIDLQSQHPHILEQDLMQRPLPVDSEALAIEGFDVISLSLVLNYVSDAADRGDMLKRVAGFLRPSNEQTADAERMTPGVFIVLPAPCVCNSRYLNETRLVEMMQSLGYEVTRKKYTDKIAYFYWRFVPGGQTRMSFPKREIAPGPHRNNFAIVLK